MRLALLCCLLGTTGNPVTITLHDHVELTRNDLRLGDVARIDAPEDLRLKLAAVALGSAPAPGYERHITPSGVVLAARLSGFDVKSSDFRGAVSTRVGTRHRLLPADRLILEARAHLQQVLGSGGIRLLMEVVREPAVVAVFPDLPEPTFRASVQGSKIGNPLTVQVEVYQGDVHVDDRVVSLRVRRFGPVLRLLSEIERGEFVRPSQVIRVDSELTDLKGGPVASITELGQRISRRRLAAGSVLENADFEEPLLVKRGDPVLMLFQSGPLEVSATGIALQSGRDGEWVQVSNSSSDESVRVRLSADRRRGLVIARVP